MKTFWFLAQFLMLIIGYAASLISVAMAIIDKDYMRAILFMLIFFWTDRQIEKLLGID